MARPDPRCISRAEAAAYCGLTARSLDGWIRRGLVPGPLPGTQRFDRRALDAALDRMSGLAAAHPARDLTNEEESPEDALAAWKRSREGQPQGNPSR